jgi:adenylate kinase
MKRIVILMGVPGSGKGTQAKKISQKYNYGHISTGDLCRRLEADPNGDPKEKAMLADMKAGKLVSDDLIYKMAFAEMDKFLDAGHGVVLDGAIRNLEQAKKYQSYFVNKNLVDEIVVLEIKISDEESFNRLTKRKMCKACGHILPYTLENDLSVGSGQEKNICPECGGELYVRSDDDPAIAKKRIAEQGNVAIQPILDFFIEKNLLIFVDGGLSIEKVEEEIKNILV